MKKGSKRRIEIKVMHLSGEINTTKKLSASNKRCIYHAFMDKEMESVIKHFYAIIIQ